MLLKSLELQGFKTFPEKVKFSFDKGITVVVGPNGSGKSNISDAIRWVLGEQSVKILRCVKMEDVIFNGTVNRKPKGFAEVTLTIDNTDRRLPFDQDDVAVSRRYYRSSESEYLINGQAVRLKDVHEFFMDTGLGKDGYSVISQGKIDSIVALKSNERREIFEEAAGISKYRYRKNEAENKLVKAEENLLRLNDILGELEARVGPLYEQSQKAKEYVILIDRLKSLQIGLWLSQLEESDAKLKKQQEKFSIISAQYDEAENAVQSIIEQTEQVLLKVRQSTLAIDEKRTGISKLEETSLLKKSEISVLENDIVHNKQNIERLISDVEKINKSFSFIDEKITAKKSQLKKLNLDYDAVTEELETYNTSLNNLQNNLASFSDVADEEASKYSTINSEISYEKLKLMTADATLNDFKLRLAESAENIERFSAELTTLKSEHIIVKNNFDEVANQFSASSEAMKAKENESVQLKKLCDELKNSADTLNLDYEEKIRKVRFLEELERNLEGFSQSVKFVLKESKKGHLAGICGAVSSLIEVPKDYVVAIETALGAAAQNIVVDSEEHAKAAIRQLQGKNVGRATFLPVSTMRGTELAEGEFLKEHGVINLASKLCACDDKYKNILCYLLGRVLIVDNLDSAIFISKKYSYRFKVVTLDGQVVNAGGSLTGGARVKNLGLLDRNNNIKELQAQVCKLRDNLQTARETLKAKLAEQLELDSLIVSQKKSLEALSDKKFQQGASLKNMEFKLSSLTESLNAKVKARDDLSAKISDLETQKVLYEKNLAVLNSQLEKSSEKIKSLNSEKDDIVAQRDAINNSIYEKNLALLALKKDIESVNDYLRDAETQKLEEKNKVVLINDEVEDLKRKNVEIENKIDSITKEIANAKVLIADYYSQIDLLTVERMTDEKRATELRNLERTKNAEKEKISLEVSRIQDQQDSLQKEYDDVIGKLWNEYELTRREALEAFEKAENALAATKSLNEVKLKIKALGAVNVGAIEEYKEVSERYEFLKSQIEDVENSKKELYKLINSLTYKMKDLFAERFIKINDNFDKVFKDLFDGGRAELKLSNPDDILNSGIEIFVQPPGKIVTHLEALSGGEKAFISIALYFAIMKVNPVPFCVLDEIEAALDEVNVARFASYLKKVNHDTQFIVVSHRRGTMEEADVLYGVTMQEEGVSTLLELNVSEYQENFLKEIS